MTPALAGSGRPQVEQAITDHLPSAVLTEPAYASMLRNVL
jgi:hypothetical protein